MKNAPIQRKLMTIIMLTSGVALLFTCAAFFAYEFVTYRTEMVRRLSTMGEVIADNSTAALVFENQADAEEVLSALAAEPHIVAAALYDKAGKLFSKYPGDLQIGDLPTTPGSEGYRFEQSHLAGFQPVIQNGGQVGTLFLKTDMGAMYERTRLYGILVFLVVLASLSVSYVLSRKLQKQISHPILALTETAIAISKRRDYTVRAVKSSDDELGLLTDAFNQMLVQIHEQDRGLRESEERFRLMVLNVQEYAIIMLDPSGCVVTWNAGAERMQGFKEKEILGENYSRFFIANAIESREPEYKLRLAAKMGRDEYETWRIRKDGTRFRANVVLTALWKDTGHLRGFCEVTREITERNPAERRDIKPGKDLKLSNS